VELIVYSGWPVALAGADEVYLHPALLELADREQGHALVRFVCGLALHAFELATRLEEGPFDQGRAERFARALLMPAEEFLALADESDAELAGRFGVPIEQVPARRMELGSPATGGRSCP